jgi:hypothetical protein
LRRERAKMLTEPGEVQDPQGFKPGQEMGELARDNCVVPLDVWRHVLDAEGKKTGYLRRERMKTAQEVFRELEKALDLYRCDACGGEKPIDRKKKRLYCQKHEACPVLDKNGSGGEFRELIDEYFSGPTFYWENFTIPFDYRRICVFPVTGGSEGHYVHVGILTPNHNEASAHGGEPLYREFALLKTFYGWDYAVMLSGRIAKLLGA